LSLDAGRAVGEMQRFGGTCVRCTARFEALFEPLVRTARMTCPYCANDVPLTQERST
jgi:hypothetical protein